MTGWQDEIRNKLGELKLAIRRYLLIEGAAVVVVLGGLWFWLTYFVDVGYFGSTRLELPKTFRSIALVGGLAAIVGVGVGWLVTRVFRPLRIDSLALLLERKFPEFNGRLMTALRSYTPEGDAAEAMSHRNERDAADRLRDVDVLAVLNPKPLRRWGVAAAALIVSVGAFWATNASAMGRWSDAYLRGKVGYWDAFRKTDIELRLVRQPGNLEVPFVDGRAKHARGAHLTVIAVVPEGRDVPRRVLLSVASAGGQRDAIDQDIPMTASGDGRFRHTVLRVVDDLELHVSGGDFTTTSPYHVDVVDPPRIDSMTLVCDFPEYTGLNDTTSREVPVEAAAVELPVGTAFTLNAVANKPLAEVRIGGPDADAATSVAPAINASPAEWSLPGFVGDPTLLGDREAIAFASPEPLEITLTDSDGLVSQQPIEITFLGRRDESPVIAVEPAGVGTSVTRQARLPFEGVVADDYALNEAWFEYEQQVGDESIPTIRQLLDVDVSGRREVPLDAELAALDLRPLGFTVGTRLRLRIAASDTNSLTGPGFGQSDTTSLTIVSDEELLTLLYDKEVNLRQRFERILEEVRETRDDIALARDKSKAATEADVWNQLAAATEQAVLSIRKNESETRSIIALFADIRAELVNNRVDTDDKLERIDRGIVGPLERIVGDDFPETDTSIVAARAVTRGETDYSTAAESLGAASRNLDRLVAKLERVLDEMQRRQSFNQMIKELQRLLELQKALKEKTDQKSVEDLIDIFD